MIDMDTPGVSGVNWINGRTGCPLAFNLAPEKSMFSKDLVYKNRPYFENSGPNGSKLDSLKNLAGDKRKAWVEIRV